MKANIGATIDEPGSSKRNKTGSWRREKPVLDYQRCTKCGICWIHCPDAAIDENLQVNYDYCKGCGVCANECPIKAIKMEEEEK